MVPCLREALQAHDNIIKGVAKVGLRCKEGMQIAVKCTMGLHVMLGMQLIGMLVPCREAPSCF